MTYKELMDKAHLHFDPERKGIIKGYPVGVLFCIGRMADAKGWDQLVDEEPLRERLTGSETLDKGCVAAVLGLLGG